MQQQRGGAAGTLGGEYHRHGPGVTSNHHHWGGGRRCGRRLGRGRRGGGAAAALTWPDLTPGSWPAWPGLAPAEARQRSTASGILTYHWSHSLAAVVSSVTGPRLGSLVSTDGVVARGGGGPGLEAGWVLAHCTAAASLPCQPSPGMLGGWAELAGAGGCYHPATTPARPHHSPLMGASHTDTLLPPAYTGASPASPTPALSTPPALVAGYPLQVGGGRWPGAPCDLP